VFWGVPRAAAPPQFMAKCRHQVFPAIKADASLKEVPAAPGLSRNDSVREHGRFSGARQTTGKVSTTRSRLIWQIRCRPRPRVPRLTVGPDDLAPYADTHGAAYIKLRGCAPSCLTFDLGQTMRLLILPLFIASLCRAEKIGDIWGVVDIEDFVSRATVIQLHSIDPTQIWSDDEKKPEGEFFHRYRSLGFVRSTDKDELEKMRRAVLDALRSIRWGEPPLTCFEPRHGVRLEKEGEVFDIIICFECENSEVYYGGKYQLGPIGRLGQKEMNALLDSHSVGSSGFLVAEV